MLPNQTMIDANNRQVALFPLVGFSISQGWYETFSHNPNSYYATDFLGLDSQGQREFRAPCYAPVDIELKYTDSTECMALWVSTSQVHFADNTIDYLSLIVYHDNDIANGTYSPVGTIKRQGEVFNHTGTGGNVTGDHVHIETGKGFQNSMVWHFTDNTTATRIVPDNVLFVNDTIVTPYPRYNWITYQGGHPGPTPTPTPTGTSNKWLRALKCKKIRIRL